MQGSLSDAEYPYIGSLPPAGAGAFRPQDLIVFVVGGTTYEEARLVAELNAGGAPAAGVKPGSVRVLFGGTSVQNSRTFLEDLGAAAQLA